MTFIILQSIIAVIRGKDSCTEIKISRETSIVHLYGLHYRVFHRKIRTLFLAHVKSLNSSRRCSTDARRISRSGSMIFKKIRMRLCLRTYDVSTERVGAQIDTGEHRDRRKDHISRKYTNSRRSHLSEKRKEKSRPPKRLRLETKMYRLVIIPLHIIHTIKV
ncbi:hypothetical protein P5V15_012020 [Pogonomyrmex californicus]